MSRILGSITNTLGWLFRNLLSSWRDLTPVPPKTTEPPKLPVSEEGLEEEKEEASNYEIADKGNVTSESKSESESDNESESEENKIIFWRIKDLAPKRIVKTRRISD